MCQQWVIIFSIHAAFHFTLLKYFFIIIKIISLLVKKYKKCPPTKGDWDCCTKESPCGEGEGGCEHGYCKEGLECGKHNCRNFADMYIFNDSDHIQKWLSCCKKPEPGMWFFKQKAITISKYNLSPFCVCRYKILTVCI